MTETLDAPEPNRKPYNSDPKDQPEPEANMAAWLKLTERFVRKNREPALTWAEIQDAARFEGEKRFNEFLDQKNYAAVEAVLDSRNGNTADDLLEQTWALNHRDLREVM